jgi:hypothetical protein
LSRIRPEAPAQPPVVLIVYNIIPGLIDNGFVQSSLADMTKCGSWTAKQNP